MSDLDWKEKYGYRYNLVQYLEHALEILEKLETSNLYSWRDHLKGYLEGGLEIAKQIEKYEDKDESRPD